MITAKKLSSETEAQPEPLQEQQKETGNTKTQSVVKLLIMMLLTYVIIFM